MIWSTFGRRWVQLPSATAAYAFFSSIITALIREKLTANRTYYVRSDGSDSNTGLVDSAGGAFLTIQKAWNVIVTLDLAGFTATIDIGTATFTAGLVASVPPVGGNITINGDGAANTILSMAGDCIIVSTVAAITVQNLKVVSSGLSGLRAIGNGAKITVGAGVEFGACAVADMWAQSGGYVAVGSNYTKSGNSGRHILAQLGGLVELFNHTATISGTPAFATGFAIATMTGMINASSVVYSGAATGTRYDATLNGVVNSSGGGATFFPGNVAGTTALGGQYA